MQNFMNQMLIGNTYHRILWMFFMIFLYAVFAEPVQAQSKQNLEEQRKKALQEIDETNRFLNETQRSQRESLERLQLLNAQVQQFGRLINTIQAEIVFAERQIGETSTTVSRMSHEIEKMKTEYAKLLSHAYQNRGRYNRLIYVLSASDFNEAYRRFKYFQQYSEYRKKQVAEIRTRQGELQSVIQKLELQKGEKEKLLAEQRRERQRLESVKVEEDRVANSLKSKEKVLRAQLFAREQKARSLQNEIEKLITADAKKRNTTITNLYEKLTPEERFISDHFKGNRGRLPWPVEKGVITKFFGKNIPHPLFKNVRRDNDGIDITTIAGASVRAVFDGEIIRVGFFLGTSIHVVIKHGNYLTLYENLVNVSVKMGDKVKAKQTLGNVYTERGAESAILHFEIWEGLNKLNPELWIAKN